MKLITLHVLLTVLFFACVNPDSEKKKLQSEKENAAVVLTVDELYDQAVELEGKKVTVKGTVMHVCRQGGGRCFLMGSNENFNIRVEAGEKIGTFSQEQMGSELTITGIFKQVRTEADAHNPEGEHGTEDHVHDEDAEESHRIILQAQENSGLTYFMEGIEIVQDKL